MPLIEVDRRRMATQAISADGPWSVVSSVADVLAAVCTLDGAVEGPADQKAVADIVGRCAALLQSAQARMLAACEAATYGGDEL